MASFGSRKNVIAKMVDSQFWKKLFGEMLKKLAWSCVDGGFEVAWNFVDGGLQEVDRKEAWKFPW